MYHCYAVVFHLGTASSGHYVCVASHRGVFYEFNDSNVSIYIFARSIYAQLVHQSQNIFLLFPSEGKEMVCAQPPPGAVPPILQAGGAGAKPEEARRHTLDAGKVN